LLYLFLVRVKEVIRKAKLIKLFEEYFYFGGFPETVFLEESLKIKTLQEYVETMLYRDIAERYKVKDILILKYFLKRLAENTSRFISVKRVKIRFIDTLTMTMRKVCIL